MNISDLDYILPLLSAPFPVNDLNWRIGNKSNWDKKNNCPKDKNKPVKAQMLVYIDARDVQERLDEVCGLWWSNDFKEVNNRIVCNLTIRGVTRTDGAGDTDFEGEKGGLSDAFKRAAVLFGVGRYLYNAKNFKTWVEYDEGDTDFSMPEKAKRELKDVALKISESVRTNVYWIKKIKECVNKSELEEVLIKVRKYAKRENWGADINNEVLEVSKEKNKEFDGDKQ